MYGFNSLTPFDLLPILVLDEVFCKDGFEKATFIKNLHQHMVSNSWTNSLQPREHDGTLSDRVTDMIPLAK